jgi:hypothetical protein
MIDQACLAELRNAYGRRRKAEVPEPAALIACAVPFAARSSVSVWPAASLVAAGIKTKLQRATKLCTSFHSCVVAFVVHRAVVLTAGDFLTSAKTCAHHRRD